jgi:putative aldouronate transport system permease protein
MKYNSRFRKTLPFHLMIAAPLAFLIVFNYLPMGGIIMAFQNYFPGLGFLRSKWVGFDNFKYVFTLPNFVQVIWNTLFIALLKIILGIFVPVSFALLLNEVRNKWFKKAIQTITYLPYFLSWVVFGGILRDFLAPGGPLNQLLQAAGIHSIYFLGDAQTFPYTMAVTEIWKNFGFSAIVYLAALTGIDPNLYEAAAVDGANRWKQTVYVTLPGIVPIVSLMTVLSIGNILSAGFDQIFNLYSPIVYTTGDILDTFVYRLGMLNAEYSIATAIGLFKSAVSFILIAGSYKLADKYLGYRVF